MQPEHFRESKLQSDNDQKQISRLSEYIANSVSSDFNKFDNFPKYVQRTALSRFLARYEIFKFQLEVPGSILDLGVARGASLFTWAQLSSMFEPVNYTREIIGFDTFEGVPSVHAKDENQHSEMVKVGGFKPDDNTYEDILEAISIFDINRPLSHIAKARAIKGDIIETLPKFIEENPHLVVSLLHIDVDLYEASKLALELLANRVPKGGVILFDELNTKNYPGETSALQETLGINALRLKRFPWATTLSYAIME